MNDIEKRIVELEAIQQAFPIYKIKTVDGETIYLDGHELSVRAIRLGDIHTVWGNPDKILISNALQKSNNGREIIFK